MNKKKGFFDYFSDAVGAVQKKNKENEVQEKDIEKPIVEKKNENVDIWKGIMKAVTDKLTDKKFRDGFKKPRDSMYEYRFEKPKENLKDANDQKDNPLEKPIETPKDQLPIVFTGEEKQIIDTLKQLLQQYETMNMQNDDNVSSDEEDFMEKSNFKKYNLESENIEKSKKYKYESTMDQVRPIFDSNQSNSIQSKMRLIKIVNDLKNNISRLTMTKQIMYQLFNQMKMLDMDQSNFNTSENVKQLFKNIDYDILIVFQENINKIFDGSNTLKNLYSYTFRDMNTEENLVVEFYEKMDVVQSNVSKEIVRSRQIMQNTMNELNTRKMKVIFKNTIQHFANVFHNLDILVDELENDVSMLKKIF